MLAVIPKEFGNWNSIYHKFRQWCEEKVFEKILKSLIDSCRKYSLIEMDSTFCKVHQHAAGARKVLGKQNIETSRGGKTTKIYALVNENFQLIRLLLSGGNLHDSELAIKLLSKLCLEQKKFWWIRLFALKKFATIFISTKPSFAFQTSPICPPPQF